MLRVKPKEAAVTRYSLAAWRGRNYSRPFTVIRYQKKHYCEDEAPIH